MSNEVEERCGGVCGNADEGNSVDKTESHRTAIEIGSFGSKAEKKGIQRY